MRECRKCGEEKPLDQFHRNGKYLRHNCKACHYGGATPQGYKRWAEANRGRRHATRRLHDLKERTPRWADTEAIKKFYADCPEGHEVDHIFPLARGGLHVLANLQYLTPEENRRKGAK